MNLKKYFIDSVTAPSPENLFANIPYRLKKHPEYGELRKIVKRRIKINSYLMYLCMFACIAAIAAFLITVFKKGELMDGSLQSLLFFFWLSHFAQKVQALKKVDDKYIEDYILKLKSKNL